MGGGPGADIPVIGGERVAGDDLRTEGGGFGQGAVVEGQRRLGPGGVGQAADLVVFDAWKALGASGDQAKEAEIRRVDRADETGGVELEIDDPGQKAIVGAVVVAGNEAGSAGQWRR